MEDANIALAKRDRGHQLAELARDAEKKKHILVDHIEYDVAELEVQEHQHTAAAEERKRQLGMEVAKLDLAAEKKIACC